MIAETEINQDLAALAQDAESARLYGSPPDALVFRAIDLGLRTRAEIRRGTGFAYDVIEKCLERNSGDLRSHTEGEIEKFERAGAGVNKNPDYICVDCKGPRSYGSGQRCKKCYDAKGKANQRPPKPEIDANDQAHREAQRKIAEMVARGQKPPQSTNNGDSVIHESVKSGYEVAPAPAVDLCFCGREQPPGGKHRGTHRNQAPRRPGVTHGAPAAKYQVKYEGLTLYCDTADEVEALAEHFAGKITEAAQPLRPRTIKRAWSVDFETQDEEGTSGLTMLYLVSMLHDGMEDHEKQAVWTLIQYLKRIDAALEAAKA